MDATGNTAVEEKRAASDVAPGPRQLPSAAANATRYQPLVIVVIAVTAGIIFDRFKLAPLSFGSAWILAVCCLIAWWFAWRSGRNVFSAWPLLAAAAMAGASWHHASWYLFDRDEVGRFAIYDPSPMCI